MNKWLSRKFISAVVAFVFTIVATAGYEMPIDQVALIDGILMFYILVEGIIDAVKKQPVGAANGSNNTTNNDWGNL